MESLLVWVPKQQSYHDLLQQAYKCLKWNVISYECEGAGPMIVIGLMTDLLASSLDQVWLQYTEDSCCHTKLY